MIKIYAISSIVLLFLTSKVYDSRMVSSNVCIFLGTISVIPIVNTLLVIKLFINIFKENSYDIDLAKYADQMEKCEKYGAKIRKFLKL